ncbi:hypothetical protein EJB05_16555, partial [Eragrostis curvula]
MSLVAYDASSDEEDAGEPPAAVAPSPPPSASSVGPQRRPSSPSTSGAAAPQPTPPPAPSQNVVPASSSNVSLPTPSLDLPDVADLFAPPSIQSQQSRTVDHSSRENASRKRESNGSVFQDSKNKCQRTQSQPRGSRSVAGNSLIPPQLRGRSNVVTEDMSKLFVAKRKDTLPSRRPAAFASIPAPALAFPSASTTQARSSSLSRFPEENFPIPFAPHQNPKPLAGIGRTLSPFDQWRISAHYSMGTVSTARVQEGLDYLNSEEPGDESQATAIDVVEKLLEEDDRDTSQKVRSDQISRTKLTPILGTKVAQCLAKRADLSSPFQKSGNFDWIDTPNNDECTASIISRKKQRIHAITQVKQLPAQRYGANGSGTRAGFLPEYTEDNSGENSFKQPEPVGSTDDLFDAYDVGPSTQMAAEAMEALSSASTVNFIVREDEHFDGSNLISLGKERNADKMPSVESPVENRIGGSSSSFVKHPRKLGSRKHRKVISAKVKRSMGGGIMEGTISHEVSEGIMGSGADNSNFLGSDAVIHPKRKRAYMFISGSSKIEFNKASRSTTVTAKSREVADSSTRKTVSIPDPDFNQFAGLEEQPRSLQKDHNSSVTRRVPLRELNNTPKSSAHISKKPQQRGLLKSPGSRELASLFRNEVSPILPSSRQRRNMSKIRVLLSQSMDKETIKLQTKILTYFGLPVATSISDATHFVAEKFARTRNMLEAISVGIPIVTPSWLECCGEARCFIDEKKYIMRDIKKEKELGFSMPVSLSRACKKPLLEGRRVLITPHAKPSKEVLKSLVAAAHGQPLERITAPMMKNKNFEGTFVISCEQDHSICLPFLKNGFEVFDSELLLNGIITQKLEFERYRLFHEKAL